MKKHIYSIVLCLIIFVTHTTHALGAYIYLDPTSGTIDGSNKFEVKIRINTEGEKPTTTDAIVVYDPEKLKVVEVKQPQQAERFFPRFFLNNKANKVFVGSAILPQGTPQSGDGLIATIVFEGVADGASVASVQCETGKTTDSNITLKKNQRVTDIIDCSKATSTAITVSGVGGGTITPTVGLSGTPRATATPNLTRTPTPSPSLPAATPTIALVSSPTPTASPSATITPSQLPETGNIEPTTIAVSIGLVLALIGVVIKIIL